jgi:hypothetical protein
VEFVLVGTMLTFLTLAVLQFGFAVYVRNVVYDAAVDGAYHAALADTPLSAGADRARQVIARTVGDGYAQDVTVASGTIGDQPVVLVTVHATLPLVGLAGVPRGVEVTGHAPVESLE